MALRSSGTHRPCSITTTSRRRFRDSIGRKTSDMRSGSGCMSKTRGGMVTQHLAHNAALAAPEDAKVVPAAGVRQYLSCIRYGDIFVLQGSPLLGAAFAIGTVTADRLAALV